MLVHLCRGQRSMSEAFSLTFHLNVWGKASHRTWSSLECLGKLVSGLQGSTGQLQHCDPPGAGVLNSGPDALASPAQTEPFPQPLIQPFSYDFEAVLLWM